MIGNYIYFAMILGRKPEYNSISAPLKVMSLMSDLQQEQFRGPASCPGLDVQKVFYGRAVWRPDSLPNAVTAIGPDCVTYLIEHTDIVPLRIEHYTPELMLKYPECKQEADKRPIYGDMDMTLPDKYYVSVKELSTNQTKIVCLHANSAADAVKETQDQLCWENGIAGLVNFGQPRLARKSPNIEPDIFM